MHQLRQGTGAAREPCGTIVVSIWAVPPPKMSHFWEGVGGKVVIPAKYLRPMINRLDVPVVLCILPFGEISRPSPSMYKQHIHSEL